MESRNETQVLARTRVRSSKEVLVSRLGQELVMLDLRSERYFSLDPVGTDFWEALTAAPSAAAAVDALLGLYDVDRETLTRDLARMIAQLSRKGLLEVSDAEPA